MTPPDAPPADAMEAARKIIGWVDNCAADVYLLVPQVAAEIEKRAAEAREEIAAEAYQIIGALAHHTGTSEAPDVISALDRFSDLEKHPESLLPWPKNKILSEDK